MDVDRFVSEHQASWERLAVLTRAFRRTRRLVGADEIAEMIGLYHRTAAHLSQAQTVICDPSLVARLTQLVASASVVVYGSRPKTLGHVRAFFAETFPAAVWHLRWFIAVAAALLVVPALVVGFRVAASPQVLDSVGPLATPALRAVYVHQQFVGYYRSQPSIQFASKVYTNNVLVGFEAFAFGIACCVGTAVVLVTNGINIGVAAGLFAAAGQLPLFFGLILPHGLLELTSVAVAGGAGLRLGWTIIDPGDRTRADALAEEGRRAVVMVLGLVVTFAVAGTIEGFVTGSALPTIVRVLIGVCAETLVVAWVVVRGRTAAIRGLTGVLDESPVSSV